MRRVLTLFVIAAAAVVAAPSIASSGIEEDGLFVELVSPVEPLTFEATFVEDESCVEDPEFQALVEANGTEVTPISVTQNPADPDNFVIVLLSDTPPGELFVEIVCDNGDGESEEFSVVEWAAIPVTKVVSGPAPATATFTVHLDCQSDEEGPELPVIEQLPEDFVVDLHYGVAGGLKYAYTDHPGICTVTEPNSGGATTVSISPDAVDTRPAPATYPVTVTNTFATAAQPTFAG